MKKEDLYILMLEDNSLDAELNIEQLQLLEEYNCIIKVIQDKNDFLKEINATRQPDIILCDYNLPQYNGMEALKDLNSSNLMLPFIFVTGTMHEEVAADAIKAGAWDYVVKDRLFRLPLAVRSVLNLKKEKELSLEANRKSQRLLRAVEETNAQIMVLDESLNIEYVNKNFSKVTGFLFNEVINKPVFTCLPKDEKGENGLSINEALIDKIAYKSDILNHKKNGEEYWEHISIAPIFSGQNKIHNYIIIKEDITDKKKNEQELIEARIKAEESAQLKTAFLQNMSHEIRTPLNAICGFSELLLSPENTQEKREYFVSLIQNSSDHLLSILNDIITISSLQKKQEVPKIDGFNINDILNDLHEIIHKQIVNKNISILIKKGLPDDQALISTDKTKVTQVLSNLINNAVKFTSEGIIEIGYSLKDSMIEFYVKDNGIGIHPDYHDVIFERFRQANETINVNYGGSGLGLSIAKGYIELLKGRIWVESEPGKGATFRFTLPFNNTNNKSFDMRTVRKSIDSSYTILIAEDEDINQMFIEELFIDSNFKIIMVGNGNEAVEACKENPDIDLVLMDIKMPELDGYSAAKIIKEIRSNLPIIAQTAYALTTEIESYKDTFDGYVTKPINHDYLFDAIYQCLNIK